MAVAPTLASKIELYLEAHNLPSFDVTSKTDAFVVLEMKAPNGSWMPIGKSEVIMNSNNPKFTTQFQLEYRFEENQPIRAVIWDYDELTAHDYIAEVETTIGKIMGSRGSTLNAQLVRRQGRPLSAARTSQMSLVFRASEIKNASNDRVRVQLKAANLAAKDSGFFGIGASSDPYFVISRIMGDGSKLKVYESPRLDKNLNPTWPMFEASIQSLCNNDLSAPLAVDVWDWDAHSSHDLIGSTTLTLQQLLDAPKTSHQWPLIKDKHKSKSGYTNSGLLMVNSIQYVKVPSFLDYLKGGMQLNCLAAVDYTGSNGDPRSPSSLHYVNPMGGYNEYLQALTATVPIVLDYDSDKMIAAYGFGGAIGGSTSHCFHLNMNPSNPEVAGLEGLVAAYKNSFNYVGLSGPTYFAPIIRQAAKIASSGDNLSQANQKYTVLILLTDGAVNDEEETARAIIDASELPLSIVLVGVGGADFGSLERLDGDSGMLKSGGKRAKRDICQFVPFRNFARFGSGAGSMLAKEVLKEIPGQVISAMMLRGIMPNPPIVMASPPPMVAASPMMVPPVAGGAGAPAPAGGMMVPPVAAPAAANPYPTMMAPAPIAGAGGGAYPGGMMGGLLGALPAGGPAPVAGPYPSLPGVAPPAGAGRPQGSI